jgi:hypothetical protein
MHYPLLVLLVGWLVVQVLLLVGAYFTAVAVVERGNVARVWLVIAGASLTALILFVFVRGVCHECLRFPSVAGCERRSGVVDTQIESNRIGGYIKERQFAGCVFYWHESNSGGD